MDINRELRLKRKSDCAKFKYGAEKVTVRRRQAAPVAHHDRDIMQIERLHACWNQHKILYCFPLCSQFWLNHLIIYTCKCKSWCFECTMGSQQLLMCIFESKVIVCNTPNFGHVKRNHYYLCQLKVCEYTCVTANFKVC